MNRGVEISPDRLTNMELRKIWAQATWEEVVCRYPWRIGFVLEGVLNALCLGRPPLTWSTGRPVVVVYEIV